MTDNFPPFAKLVVASFQAIAKSSQVYVTSVDGDALYQRYLDAFPEGTNPIFQKKAEHECSCCRQFIRRAGNVVSVNDQGTVLTVWDDSR